MGHRLSKIYTRTGDKGTTGLGDGSRVDKDSIRVEAYGNVDELNSVIGLLLSNELPESISEQLTIIQHTLFDVGGEMSIPGRILLASDQVTALEDILDTLNSDLGPLKEFILPGGSPAASVCHIARCVCRRAERSAIALAKSETVNETSIAYLNRLSDLLFVIARHLNKAANVEDVLWNNTRQKKPGASTE